MSKYTDIRKIVNKLHEINFNKIIKYDDFDVDKPDSFTFDAKQERFKEHAKGYCEICESKCDDEYFKLNNISHGSHTIDFLHSFEFNDENIESLINDKEWTDEPVLFLMENPSLDRGNYDYISSDESKTGKRPVANWYWIHGSKKREFDKRYYEDDTYFVQSEYGNLVAALIYQYKLSNAYLTNLVKCGISDARIDEKGVFVETKYKNLSDYPSQYIKNCAENILLEEIKALCSSNDGKLKPLRVFAFGDRPYYYIREILRSYGKNIGLKFQIYQLPHPASREKNYYRKFILKGAIYESLNNNNFVDSSEQGELYSASEVEKIFKNEYQYKLGKKISKNKYSLNMNTIKSYSTDVDLVTEVWVKGNGSTNENVPFKWGIGYVFESKDYWYWNYDTEEYVSETDIPDYNLFKEAIEKILDTNR